MRRAQARVKVHAGTLGGAGDALGGAERKCPSAVAGGRRGQQEGPGVRFCLTRCVHAPSRAGAGGGWVYGGFSHRGVIGALVLDV